MKVDPPTLVKSTGFPSISRTSSGLMQFSRWRFVGSMPSMSARSSIADWTAKLDWTPPYPLKAPAGGLSVKTA